mgnify:CR=1 FL=1
MCLDPFFVRARIWTLKPIQVLLDKHMVSRSLFRQGKDLDLKRRVCRVSKTATKGVSIPFSSGQGFGPQAS